MPVINSIIREEVSRSQEELAHAKRLDLLWRNHETYPFENYEAETRNALHSNPLYVVYNTVRWVRHRIRTIFLESLTKREEDVSPEPVEQICEIITRYPTLWATLDTVKKIFWSDTNLSNDTRVLKN